MRTSYLFAVLSFALAVSAAPHNSANQVSRFSRRANGNKGGFFGSNNGGNKGGSFGGKGGKNNNGNANGGGKSAGGVAGANNGTAAGSNGGGGNNTAGANNGTAAGSNGGGGNNGGQDAQKSLTLDPGVIAQGFANDGQDVPAAGQVASLTSTNNFINFCLTVPNLKITNGQQITEGSCNPAPIGAIPSSDNMPSSKFSFPPNGGTIQENTPFTISMNIRNLETGNFVNAEANFLSAPQQLNQQGQIRGHSHVVVEQLTSVSQTSPTDPTKFAFFKGLNGAAKNGVLTADVTNGLPAGAYKLASINTNANHAPCVVPIAQHGSLDDAIYFTVTANGQAADDSGASGADNSTSAAGGNAGAGNAGNGKGSGAGQGGAGAGNAGNGDASEAGQGGAGNSTVIGAGNAGNSTASGAGNAGAGNAGNGKGSGAGKGGAGNGKASGAGQGGAGNSTVTGAGNAGNGDASEAGQGGAGNSTASGAGNAGAGQKGSSKGHTGGGQGRQGQEGQKGGRSWARSRF